MKIYSGILICVAGLLSCTGNNKPTVKMNIKDSCNVTSSVADCLDITTNPDTSMLSQKIDTSTKKLLIIFPGRGISGKGLLDKEFLENRDIFKELKKYSIYLLYVDKKMKIKDSLVSDQSNMIYQQNYFKSAIHPHYISYLNGTRQCEEHYLNNAKDILHFLQCQSK